MSSQVNYIVGILVFDLHICLYDTKVGTLHHNHLKSSVWSKCEEIQVYMCVVE